MMLVIDIDFLHGSLRAGSASDASITGHTDPGEWPPSPARIFSAFVAADGTRDSCRVTDSSELRLLDSEAPEIIADPGGDVARSPLRERYVVGDTRSTGAAQDYPARKATVVRPGSWLSPRSPHIRYVYRGVNPSSPELLALRRRAARIGYLGAADHPVRVRVSTADDGQRSSDRAWRPHADGTYVIPVPDKGFLERLDASFDRFSRGEPVRRSWIATASARYLAPGDKPAEPSATLLWLRLQQSLAPQRFLYLTETFRQAVLSQLGDDAAQELHGHGPDGREGGGWLQARYLAFPDVGHRYADGRLHGVAVWLPPATPTVTVAATRRALLDINVLHCPGVFSTPVTPHDGETGIQTTRTRRWTGVSRRWLSATPVIYERHGDAGLEDVRTWFRHAGLPEPATAKLFHLPTLQGAVRLQPRHLRHRYRTRFAHLEVEFDQPVHAGPVVVGRGRQFGLGLMAPDRSGLREAS